MKNKGFTLIELLAVIVILAIIALIATPIILGIINDARTQARKRSAELAYTGVEYAITSYMYSNGGQVPSSVKALEPYFKVENVNLVVPSESENNNKGTIKENGAADDTKLCDITYETGKFTVTCEGLIDEPKTITLS